MSPPTQESDKAISNQNGINPSPIVQENSIEREVLRRTDRNSRTALLKSIILAYSGENLISIDTGKASELKALQSGIKNILIEHNGFLQINKGDILGIKEREQYLSEVISYYFSFVFFQPHLPNLSELDFRLLNECIRVFKDDDEPKGFSDICVQIKLDDTPKAATFLRFAFSANVDNDLRESARLLLDVISEKCEKTGTKTRMVLALRAAKNTFEKIKGVSGGIEELIESWLRGS